MPFANGTSAARDKIVARTDEDRSDFLRNRGFSKAETARIIDTVLAEEGRKPESIFDFVQGITAVARDKPPTIGRFFSVVPLIYLHAFVSARAQGWDVGAPADPSP
jgi:hypothetical protein